MGRSRYSRARRVRPVFIMLLLIAVFGCAHQSVRHLNKQPMISGDSSRLRMDYWVFHYETEETKKGVVVQGIAYPVRDAVPTWATWIDDLWMEAYLGDERGHVLARDLRVFSSQELDLSKGIPFSFLLNPEQIGSPGPVYITFGYRMVLNPGEQAQGGQATGPTGDRNEFFASEGALTRY